MNGDDDEVQVEPQQTQVDGSETSKSQWTAHHSDRAGDIDVSPQQHLLLWVEDQSGTWWKHCSSPGYPEYKFRSHFQMGWETFDMICDVLGSASRHTRAPACRCVCLAPRHR
jgi:hypothetical protein